jgi:hypothetical protein
VGGSNDHVVVVHSTAQGTVAALLAEWADAGTVKVMSRDDESPAAQPLAALFGPIQARLPMEPARSRQRWLLQLSGLRVLVEPHDRDYDQAAHYARVGGIDAHVDEILGVVFDVRNLHRLSHLPLEVDCSAEALLAPLVALAFAPPPDGTPATVTVDPDGTLRLRWDDGESFRDEGLDRAASAALVASGLPFVATEDAWSQLLSAAQLGTRATLVTARATLDGYVEMTAAVPQLLEAAVDTYPALFRLDDTRFGLPAAHAATLGSQVTWVGAPPSVDAPPPAAPFPVQLSAPVTAACTTVTRDLAAWRARLLAWPSGTGRRVLALATLHALDAFPALVVCPPEQLWVWQRHVARFGRTTGFDTSENADVHLITYRDLAAGRGVTSPAAVIFDQVVDAALDGTLPSAAAQLDGVAGAYRIGICTEVQAAPETLIEVMAALVPSEFDPRIPLHVRYPRDPQRRARAHVETYLNLRTDGPVFDQQPEAFSPETFTVETIDPDPELTRAMLEAVRVRRRPLDAVDALVTIASSGTAHHLSPKVATAARLATRARTGGRAVAVVTFFERTAGLLTTALGSVHAHEDARPWPGRVTVVCAAGDRELADLSGFDDVIVVDYPPSFEAIDAALGVQSRREVPQRVTVVHLRGSLDDRLAVLAAVRRPARHLSAAGAQYLLAGLRLS